MGDIGAQRYFKMNQTNHPKEKGQCSEAAVIFEFVKRGMTVLEPFGDNERYDLVVESCGSFLRIQVKTGRLDNGRVQFETRSTGTLTRRVVKEDYTGEIDFFAVYSPDLEETYVVPKEDTSDTTMGLRVTPAKKNSPNINWAKEYQIDRWAKKFRE